MTTWQHVANEWADAATNGVAYLRNVEEGLSPVGECIDNLLADIAHCRTVQQEICEDAIPPEPETKTLWVAYTNSDCTEGRGPDIPAFICETETTARRCAHKIYVQGSDGPVRPMQVVKIKDQWYVPHTMINIVKPTVEDIAVEKAEKVVKDRLAAVTKARAAGLTDEDISALQS